MVSPVPLRIKIWQNLINVRRHIFNQQLIHNQSPSQGYQRIDGSMCSLAELPSTQLSL